MGTDLIDGMNRETEQHPIAARSRSVREQAARGAGWNAGAGKVDSVGPNRQGDVESIIHDEKRAASGRRFPQFARQLEELTAAAIPGPELHDDSPGGARSVYRSDNGLG